uniref:ribosome silencing factor n=1 Tax=Methylohalobius crimeensis TaxID=244365 RepID=UPI00047B51C3|nr:ribosome silencing factor [Methylohalobius crimeensis]
METEQLLDWILDALDDLKAKDVATIDVRGKTSVTDYMVVASGTSERHVRALAENVVEKLSEHHMKPLGVEGQHARDWVLVDAGDVIVHVMLPETRAFYQLEKLWQVDAAGEDLAPA